MNQFSQNGSGFIYFNNSSSSPGSANTSEFLAFNDNHLSPHKFSPTSYSSPQMVKKYGVNNYQQGDWKQGRYFKNQSFSSANSSSNSYDSCPRGNRNKLFKQRRNFKKPDIFKYLHSSFIQDPWSNLEKQHYIKLQRLEQMKQDTQESVETDEKHEHRIGIEESIEVPSLDANLTNISNSET